jgi:hypothetical protein
MPSSRLFQITSRPFRVCTTVTPPAYDGGMFDVGDSLRDALAAGRDWLLEAQTAVACANAGNGGGARSAGAAMAQAAQAAIFTEALLSAERARFEAIKAASR